MGIVVSIGMLLGLIALLSKQSSQAPMLLTIRRISPIVLLVLGLWNFLWYGLQHLNSFWGIAALVSGLVMVNAALLIHLANKENQSNTMETFAQFVKPMRWITITILLLSFILYAVTIIQLNLGYPIIR